LIPNGFLQPDKRCRAYSKISFSLQEQYLSKFLRNLKAPVRSDFVGDTTIIGLIVSPHTGQVSPLCSLALAILSANVLALAIMLQSFRHGRGNTLLPTGYDV